MVTFLKKGSYFVKMELASKVFGEEGAIILRDAVLHHLTRPSFRGENVPEEELNLLAKYHVEQAVDLGLQVAAESPTYFCEMASGLGIPGMVLTKLGYDGRITDSDLKWVNRSRVLAKSLGVNANVSPFDIYSNWNLPEGTFIVAKSPHHGGEGRGLETRILRGATLSGKHDIAIVPRLINPNDWKSEQAAQLGYFGLLKSRGYGVSIAPLKDGFNLYNCVIGVRKTF